MGEVPLYMQVFFLKEPLPPFLRTVQSAHYLSRRPRTDSLCGGKYMAAAVLVSTWDFLELQERCSTPFWRFDALYLTHIVASGTPNCYCAIQDKLRMSFRLTPYRTAVAPPDSVSAWRDSLAHTQTRRPCAGEIAYRSEL